MTTIRIQLTADDFRALVSGKPLVFDERDMIRTRRFSFGPSHDHSVNIILEDMGWPDMAAIVREVWHEDAPESKTDFEKIRRGLPESEWQDQSVERKS